VDFYKEIIKIYNDIDTELKEKSKQTTFSERFHDYLVFEPRLKKYSSEIDLLSKIRNLIAHNNKTSESIEVKQELVIIGKEVLNILNNPIIANNLGTKIEELYFVTLNTKVNYVIEYMRKKRFSFVPILDQNNKLIGVFSSDVLLNILSKKIYLFDNKELLFKNIIEFVDINNHTNEKFSIISNDTTLLQITKMFNNSYNSDKQLGAIFVTKNGAQNESIFSMITPWDIIRNK
jgi:predicted transcriptional regulator